MQERGTAIETTLLFFELEWAALPDERAEELLAGEGLEFCRHHLRNVRRYREHLLSEPEEKILAEKSLTGGERVDAAVRGADLGDRGRAARGRTGGEATGRARRRAQPRWRCADREVRRDAPPRRVTDGARARACARARSCSTRCSPTRRTDDRLRRYPHWLAARNLANEASDESVQALIEAVRGALRDRRAAGTG